MDGNLNRGLFLAAGMAAGAGLMYMLDPERGRTRRALVRDKTGSMVLQANVAAGKRAQDLRNRAGGAVHVMGSRLRSSPLADGELAEQVRQAATGITSQLGSLHISVQNGHVTISGPILADKMQVLLERIARLPGVRAVDNRLTVYQTAGDIPLQRSEGYGAP